MVAPSARQTKLKPKAAAKQDDDGDHKNDSVLNKATVRASDYLGLTNGELALVIGVSPASITNLKSKKSYFFKGASNEYEKAMFLIRIYRSLFALIGDDSSQFKTWLRSKNDYLGTTPLEAMKSTEGLVNVTQYLDAMRG